MKSQACVSWLRTLIRIIVCEIKISVFLRLCENEFNVAGIERTEEYLGLSVGLCAGV